MGDVFVLGDVATFVAFCDWDRPLHSYHFILGGDAFGLEVDEDRNSLLRISQYACLNIPLEISTRQPNPYGLCLTNVLFLAVR